MEGEGKGERGFKTTNTVRKEHRRRAFKTARGGGGGDIVGRTEGGKGRVSWEFATPGTRRARAPER